VQRLGLDGPNPQAYETGIKEIWRIRPENHVPGRVVHTMGWPQDPSTFGGGWIYDLKDSCVSIGFVTGLDYDNPYTDPHDLMQRWKTHPRMRKLLSGGECLKYGAKTMPVGGWFSFPRRHADGMLLVGDAAGTCNGVRLKGVHLAIESGILAAETLARAIGEDDYSERVLASYQGLWDASWLAAEHYQSRNFHASFQYAQRMPRWLGWARQIPWLVNGQAIAMLTGGRGLVRMVRAHPDHEHMKKLGELTAKERKKKEKVAYDNRYTLDKVTAAALAGSRHEVDQPHHLVIADPNVCATRCVEEYGNPCESFCPVAVYEMIADEARPGRKRIVVHHENCVHCKTCDVADPYAIISWTTPEGGDGPDYAAM
jgi:electron-transferring-flavoprotein dehydrogenase